MRYYLVYTIFFLSLCCFTGCLNIIFSVHKKPSLTHDFENNQYSVIDSIHKQLGNLLFVHNNDSMEGGSILIRFDSAKINYVNYGGVVNNLLRAVHANEIIDKYASSFGTIYKKDGKYMMQIADGMRGTGYWFLYFDVIFLKNGDMVLILRKYKKFRRAWENTSFIKFLNKELLFESIKVR